MNKRWKNIDYEDCPRCGGGIEVFIDQEEEGWVSDGDEIRYTDPDCDFKGSMSVDSECMSASMNWE